MKLRDKRTGAIYEPASDFVLKQMQADPDLEPVRDEVEQAKKPATRKRTAAKEA